MKKENVIFFVLMVAVLLLSVFVYLPWRIKRAGKSIIRTFRKLNATSPQSAVTFDKLGIRLRSFWSLSLRPKDFKKEALDAMVRTGIIQMTEDSKLYLVEKTIIGTKFDELNP